MAAIIRVKRRLSEEPASSLVVSLKRSKPDEASAENGGDCDAATSNKRLFAFAGTVTQKETPARQVVNEAVRKKKLEPIRKESPDVGRFIDKWREDQKAGKQMRRLNIIDERRCATASPELTDEAALASGDVDSSTAASGTSDASRLELTVGYSEEEPALGHLADAYPHTKQNDSESSAAAPSTIVCNGVPMIRKKVSVPNVSSASSQQQDYVYDIYYIPDSAPLAIGEQIVDVEAFYEELTYDYRLMNDGEEEVYDDEDDSNDEGNWRNDYPDEDAWKSDDENCHEDGGTYGYGGFDDDEEIMRRMARGLRVGIDEDLPHEFDEYDNDEDDDEY